MVRPAVILIVRPVAVWIGLAFSQTSNLQRNLVAWFGIRGIGPVYSLMFAETHGLYDGFADLLLGLVLATIAVSVVVHGLSVSPIMKWYNRRAGREEAAARTDWKERPDRAVRPDLQTPVAGGGPVDRPRGDRVGLGEVEVSVGPEREGPVEDGVVEEQGGVGHGGAGGLSLSEVAVAADEHVDVLVAIASLATYGSRRPPLVSGPSPPGVAGQRSWTIDGQCPPFRQRSARAATLFHG